MMVIELGDGQRLELEPTREALRLYPAVAGAQFELGLRMIAAQPTTDRFGLAANVDISRISQHGKRRLCRVQSANLVTPTPRGSETRLVGLVTDEQLRVVEELRAGGDLWLGLNVEVSTVASNPPAPAGWTGDLNFSIHAGEWATQLARVDVAAYVEVLVPMPAALDLAGAVKRLAEAQQLLRDNKIDPALVAARLALEPVLEAVRDGGLAKGAAAKQARQRDLPERFAILVESLFAVLSGAAHDDEVTADFRYTRDEAIALLATTAGMVRRLAATRL